MHCVSAIVRVCFPGPSLLGRTYSGLWLTRQLGSSPKQLKGGEDGLEVRERLQRNIIRAGLRALKGDRYALEKNIKDRAVAVDLQKLVMNCVV